MRPPNFDLMRTVRGLAVLSVYSHHGCATVVAWRMARAWANRAMQGEARCSHGV